MRVHLIILFVFYVVFASAQNITVEKNQFKINFLTPGLENEIGITDRTTLSLELTAGIIYSSSYNNGDLSFFPVLESQYRYYYNLQKRATKGKRVAHNSGNYISLLGRLQSGKAIFGKRSFDFNYVAFIGPTWGMQRTYRKGFNFSLYVGAVYGFNDIGEKGFFPITNIKLGWVLNKKK